MYVEPGKNSEGTVLLFSINKLGRYCIQSPVILCSQIM